MDTEKPDALRAVVEEIMKLVNDQNLGLDQRGVMKLQQEIGAVVLSNLPAFDAALSQPQPGAAGMLFVTPGSARCAECSAPLPDNASHFDLEAQRFSCAPGAVEPGKLYIYSPTWNTSGLAPSGPTAAESSLAAATARIAEVERERDAVVARAEKAEAARDKISGRLGNMLDRKNYYWRNFRDRGQLRAMLLERDEDIERLRAAFSTAQDERDDATARAESAERERDSLRATLASRDKEIGEMREAMVATEAIVELAARGWIHYERNADGEMEYRLNEKGRREAPAEIGAALLSPRASPEDADGMGGAGEEK